MLHWPHSDVALAYFILEWVLRLLFIAFVLPGHPPTAARIWLLFGFLAPVPAALVYALIGRRHDPGKRQARETRAAQAKRQWLVSRTGQNRPASPLARFVEAIGGNPGIGGNRIKVLTDYEATVDALVSAIDKAETRVLLLTYIFATDAVGLRIVEALARARARGVDCHVMFDALGSRPWRKALLARLSDAGIPARACNLYNPLAGGTGRLDRRNHRKIYVIDESIAFTGSQNIVARDFRPGIVNHELMLRIEGPLAADLSAQFIIDWHADGGELLTLPHGAVPARGSCIAQVLASGPGQKTQAYPLLLSRLVQEAQQSILIVSPYVVLDEGLQLALVTAAMRGVKVTILVSAVIDHPVVRRAQEAGYGVLLASGVEVRHFLPGLLHAKYILVDGSRAIVGTSNADIRSFQINSEISLLTEDAELVQRLQQVAETHLGQSQALTFAEWQRRPLRQRIIEKFAALATPLL